MAEIPESPLDQKQKHTDRQNQVIALYEAWGKNDKAGAIKAEMGMAK